MTDMYVVNRKGEHEPIKFDRINKRIAKLTTGLDSAVDSIRITQKSVESIRSGMMTSEIDMLTAEIAASLSAEHPDYSKLAARIAISNHHKNTPSTFLEAMTILNSYVHGASKKKTPLVTDEVVAVAKRHQKMIESTIDHERDKQFDYFGFRTLQRGGYLMKTDDTVVERPQYMYMRIAIGIHGNNIKRILQTYDYLSRGIFTQATPTMYNSGTINSQMSSCFLLTMKDDSIDGIYETLKQCALISKFAGGLGVSIHSIRSHGSFIGGTNGVSDGIIPMLRVFNETARYVNQGGKRKGAIAAYLEVWHQDVVGFLDLRKNRGDEKMRARDIFLALWICDLFMRRVENDGEWTLFSPNECPKLYDTYGEEFETLYKNAEEDDTLNKRKIKARDLWRKIMEAQVETGTPYILYKDAVNKKSNQMNLGVIRSSNLCTEIVEYTSPDEVAVCNLGSLALNQFVENDSFNFKKLYEATRVLTYNLNKIIDKNYYPIKEAKRSNMRHRPVGIGVQGLADTFLLLRMPFASQEAKRLNKEIFEAIYYGALTESNAIAKKDGHYESYKGSPISKGVFQYQLWGLKDTDLSGLWDWEALRKKVSAHGVRNSLLVALMPTASTAQILGNTEAFEPISSNLYVRRVLSGDFTVANKHLLKDLTNLGLWDEEMKHDLILNRGSVQNITRIPEHIRELYKTAYEISMRDIIDMAADRGAFIDQSQSLNLFIQKPSLSRLTSMHFYSWRIGLKTGMYYLRVKPATEAIQFTVQKKAVLPKEEEKPKVPFEDTLRQKIETAEREKIPVPAGQEVLIDATAAPTVTVHKSATRPSLKDELDKIEDDSTPPNVCTSCGS